LDGASEGIFPEAGHGQHGELLEVTEMDPFLVHPSPTFL
jgi:hypothetical protein